MKTAREIRNSKGLTLEQVSKDTGLSCSTICKVELGDIKLTDNLRQKLESYYGEPFTYEPDSKEALKQKIEELELEIEHVRIENQVMYDKLAMIKCVLEGDA